MAHEGHRAVIGRHSSKGARSLPFFLPHMSQPTIDQLKASYDALYAAAADILKRENPCKIEFLPEGGITCERSRRDPKWGPGGCCQGCTHLGPKGCTVDALGCRLAACGLDFEYSTHMAGWPDHVIIDLKALRSTAWAVGVPMFYWSSKEETFNRAQGGPQNHGRSRPKGAYT